QQVTAIITDDDGPTISINNATVTEGNTGQTVNAIFSVSLSAASPQSITVDYSTADGTATAPAVYLAKSGTLTFPANSTTPQTITIVVNGDNIDEIDESSSVDLSNPTRAPMPTAPGPGTILDDDPPPTVTLSLSGSPMAEAGGVATVTATLSAPSGQTVNVDLAFSGTATLGSDYTNSGTSIVIPSGSTNGTITLTAVQDTLDEVDETVIVDISGVTNGTESGTQQVTAIISDDDSPPTVAFSAATSSGSESTTAVSVPVSLSRPSNKSVAVNYA